MKTLIIFLSIIITINSVSARNLNLQAKGDSITSVYLGFGTGLNNYSGWLGVGTNIRLYKGIFLRGGAGLGTWGNKYTIGLQLGRNRVRGWSAGLAYTTNVGIKDFRSNLEVVGPYGTPVSKEVLLDLFKLNCLNISASRNWILGKNKLMHLDLGYSYLLQTQLYSVKDGSVLTSSSNQALRIISPGGLIIGFGFMFGI